MYIVSLNATISPVNAKREQLVSTLKPDEHMHSTLSVVSAVVCHPGQGLPNSGASEDPLGVCSKE